MGALLSCRLAHPHPREKGRIRNSFYDPVKGIRVPLSPCSFMYADREVPAVTLSVLRVKFTTSKLIKKSLS